MPSPADPSIFEVPSVTELQPLFPDYDLECFIAQGGMGAVYLARQVALDRPVAIKILRPEFNEDIDFRESFSIEAKAMARLNHPNLIGVYDFGCVDGMLFIVMEYVDGNSLHDSANGGAVDPVIAVDLVCAICRGLTHAHNQGILHRDIKPANILLDGKLRPKITDFGLARPLEEPSAEGETVYGTPGYSAPELTCDGPVDQRADIYSVGALLHRLLTGREPGRAPLTEAFTSDRSPSALNDIIARATHPDPFQRFSSAAELGAKLRECRQLLFGVPGQKPAAPRAMPPATFPAGQRPSAKPQSSATAMTLAAVAVIGTAAVAFALLRTGAPPAEPDREALANDQPSPVAIDPEPTVPVVADPEPSSATDRREPADAPTESALQGLTRLKAQLAAGARDEFPEGTVAHEGSHFLALTETMAWPDAQRFAEEHGAHLAVLSTEDDRTWFRKQFRFERPLWLGAGQTGTRWQWVDASPWHPAASLPDAPNSQQRVALSASGALFATRPSQTLGLVLQWREDGSNPGTLAEQLNRTATRAGETSGENRIYPVGTLTWKDSHYFLYSGKLSWDEAYQFADSLGAYPAVPSSHDEHEWWCAAFSPALQAAPSTYWLGGYRLKPGDRWQWVSREAWNNSGWQPEQLRNSPEANRLALQGVAPPERSKWVALGGSAGVSQGVLLEWSPKRAQVTVATFELQPWLASVNRKIADRVANDFDEFNNTHERLVQDYVRSMNRIIRAEEDDDNGRGRGRRGRGGFGRPDVSRRVLTEIEEDLKKSSKEGKLLDALPFGASQAFREQQNKSKADLDRITADYVRKIEEHFAYYLQGIRKKAAGLAATGYLDQAQELRDLANSLEGKPRAFLDALFPDHPPTKFPWPDTTAKNAGGNS